MGAKGSQTTNSNQTQTTSATGSNYLYNALNTAQNAINPNTVVPTAPVAGFSGQQQQAFGLAGNTGIQNPYLQQAQGYFNQGSQPNISQFYNPEASAVTSQLSNIFGQQAAQNTGSLTQAAGGVGADRIAIGQGNLANQQGLAAGQTLANLYSTAGNQALQEQSAQQGAGYGTAALGSQAQQANLNDVNSLLTSGGLQQQLSQAQLNAPYQQQLAQMGLPYQQSNFLTSAVGSLAPALGGTTTGQGQQTSQYNPSLTSQLLGTGLIGASIFGKGSGGAVPTYDQGGATDSPASGYAPIDVSHGFMSSPSIVPQGQFQAAHLNMPQLNMNMQAPNLAQQSQQGMNQFMQLGKQASQIGNDLSPASFGGGSLFSDDAWGGNASNPLQGLSASDYGMASGGIAGVLGRGYAQGGDLPVGRPQRFANFRRSPDIEDRRNDLGGGGESLADRISRNWNPVGQVKDPGATSVGNALGYSDIHKDDGGDISGAPDDSPYARDASAIAGIESAGSGGYNALGPKTKSGDQAYGKYQVMGANIPQWTQEALGKSMTPQEFLNSPEAQDATFNHQFGKYVQKYGHEGAAKAWFAGEKGMNNPNAKDQLGTSVSAYAQKFNNAMGGQDDLPSIITSGDKGGMPSDALGLAEPGPYDPKTFGAQANALANQGTSAPDAPQPGSAIPGNGQQSQPDALFRAEAASLAQPHQSKPFPANPYDPAIFKATADAEAAGTPSPVPMPQPRPPEANAPVSAPSPPVASASPAETGPSPPPESPYSSLQKDDGSFGSKIGKFMHSPNMALLMAGLGAWTPQGIAGGFQNASKFMESEREGEQKDQTIRQTAQRLKQEAEFHRDQYTKMTPYQQGELDLKKKDLSFKQQMLGQGTMSDEAVDLAVERIRAGDPKALTNLGRGAQSGVNLTRIQNRLAERAQQEGWSGSDLAAAQANFGSQAAAARSQAVRAAGIDQAVEEARNTFPLALQASASLPRGQWVPLNQLHQAAQRAGSNSALGVFEAANQAVITAYAQAMSRTGVSTVHAQLAAEHLLSTATSPEAYQAVIGQLEMEMQAAKAAPDTVRKAILKRIGEGDTGAGAPQQPQPGAPNATAGPAAGADPLSAARAAIAKGAPRDKVIERLKAAGIDPTGL